MAVNGLALRMRQAITWPIMTSSLRLSLWFYPILLYFVYFNSWFWISIIYCLLFCGRDSLVLGQLHGSKLPSHKSHNAPDKCTILQQKCAHVYTFLLQCGAFWDMGLVHCDIGATGLVQWSDGYKKSNNTPLHWRHMTVKTFQRNNNFTVYSTPCSSQQQQKHQSYALLPFEGIHRSAWFHSWCNAESVSTSYALSTGWVLFEASWFSSRKEWWLVLTHWGRVTHIYVSKLTIIDSDNGLSPGRRQAIIWTNADSSSISP